MNKNGGAASLVRSDVYALIAFAEGLAFCPCCEGVYSCVRGCTIREDSQACADGRNRYETMLAARRALRTKPRKPSEAR